MIDIGNVIDDLQETIDGKKLNVSEIALLSMAQSFQRLADTADFIAYMIGEEIGFYEEDEPSTQPRDS